jgi:hypothetical protein
MQSVTHFERRLVVKEARTGRGDCRALLQVVQSINPRHFVKRCAVEAGIVFFMSDLPNLVSGTDKVLVQGVVTAMHATQRTHANKRTRTQNMTRSTACVQHIRQKDKTFVQSRARAM